MGLGYIIPKIIAYVEIGYDFTNKYIIKRLSQFFIICNCFITFFYCYAFSMESGEKKANSFPKFSIISNNFAV